MYRDGKGTTVNVHRAVATAFHGDPQPGMDAAHLNGVRTDNRAANLRWVTRAENLSHMRVHGTAQRGEQHGAAKLTEADVLAIRTRVREGATHLATAQELGIARATVTCIVNRSRWRHVA
ncbi:HNH endonuclease [Streptomyces longwoodensis]|uniref:HNH endonuclease n=1 Tax=Streptomyces longwoodensis TaxID=68231 RepID=UPI0033EFFBAB